jgi:hypothetical protein
MNTSLRMPYIGSRRSLAGLWQVVSMGFMQLYAAIATDSPHGDAVSMSDSMRDAQCQAMIDDARILRRAVHANFSNEIDWLLCAAILTTPAKRRYCLERALAINPDSELAKQALASIPAV